MQEGDIEIESDGSLPARQRSIRVARVTVLCLSVLIASRAAALDYAPAELLQLSEASERFAAANQAAKAATGATQPAAIRTFVQSGMTLSNLACDGWLRSLGKADQDTGFWKDIVNIVGNLLLGVGGINGVKASSLAKGNLGLGAVNASVDAFRHDFLKAVVSEIEVKIKQGREVSETALTAKLDAGELADYDVAKRRLFDYHDTCTPTAINELLKTSLANVRYAAPDSSLGQEVDRANADILAAKLYALLYAPGELGPGSFSDSNLYELWVSQVALPNDTSTSIANMRTRVAIIATRFSAKNANGELSLVLQRIADLRGYAKRLQTDLAKEQQQAASVRFEAEQALDRLQKRAAELARGLQVDRAEGGVPVPGRIGKQAVDEARQVGQAYEREIGTRPPAAWDSNATTQVLEQARAYAAGNPQDRPAQELAGLLERLRQVRQTREQSVQLEALRAQEILVVPRRDEAPRSTGSVRPVIVPLGR